MATNKSIQNFIDQWHKFDNAYFFNPPNGASQRRNYENFQSMKINFRRNGNQYCGEINIQCSCKNVYAYKSLYVNGERKTIRVLASLLKK